jgi:uncharacterized RDD family membrane protein YckC
VDTLRIQTAQNVEITYEAAGLGDRIIATMIDGIVEGAYIVGSLILLVVLGVGEALMLAIAIVPVVFYHLFCEVFFDGRTIGKDVMKIRVARIDGSPPGLGAYLLRWVLRPIDIWWTSGLVAMLSILLGRTGQRLGDRAAGTTVVRMRGQTSLEETGLVRRRDAAEPPRFPEAALLSSEDIQTVRAVLHQYRVMGRTTRSERLVRMTKEALEHKMGLPPVDVAAPTFLLQVLRDHHADEAETEGVQAGA